MALWGSKDDANNAPKYAVAGGLGVSANGQVTYQNTTISAFVTNAEVGTFGVDTTEQGVAANPKGGHAGWVLRKKGTGPITSLTITNAGALSNVGNAFVTFTAGGTANTTANARISVNATSNVVQSITLNDGGSYSGTPTATITGNANVTIAVVMGGRSGRTHVETLVAMGSMGADGSSGDDDTVFADS